MKGIVRSVRTNEIHRDFRLIHRMRARDFPRGADLKHFAHVVPVAHARGFLVVHGGEDAL